MAVSTSPAFVVIAEDISVAESVEGLQLVTKNAKKERSSIRFIVIEYGVFNLNGKLQQAAC